MKMETLEALFDRAKNIDILADDLTVLLDAAAQMGMAELVETGRVLWLRGLKIGVVNRHFDLWRKRNNRRLPSPSPAINRQPPLAGTEPLESLFERATTIDILADDLAVLLDAAAKLGVHPLVGVSQILNQRGVKIGILREYGEARRKYHALKQREQRKALDEALRRAYPGAVKYDCLR